MDYFVTGNAAKKAIKASLIEINGVRAQSNSRVKANDELQFLEDLRTSPKPYTIDFDILFEDEHLAVVNKPAGIMVSGNAYRTMQNAIIGKLKNSTEEDALHWPKPVHRLDEATSGCLLFAKTKNAQLHLSKQFEERQTKKEYHAIVIGDISKEGTISTSIDDKKSLTHYMVLKQFVTAKYGAVSLLFLRPITGRKHQLRIHLSGIGTPIMGDKLYSTNTINNYFEKGLFLCSTSLSFIHPKLNKTIKIETALPRKFNKYLNRLEQLY